MPSKPPSAQCSATRAYPATISSISAVRHRLRHLAEQRIGDCRWRPHRQPRVHRAGLAAVVIDLGEDRNAMAMDGIGDRPVAGDHVAMEAVDQLLVRPIGGMGRVLLGDDQPGATGGAGLVVGRVLLGRLAVAGVVGEVRAEDDAVAGGDRARAPTGSTGTGTPSPVTLPRRVSPARGRRARNVAAWRIVPERLRQSDAAPVPRRSASAGARGTTATAFYDRFQAPVISTDDDGRATEDRRPTDRRRRPAHDRCRRQQRRPGGDIAAVLRRQGVRGGTRPGPRAGDLPRLPPATPRRVRRMRAGARTWWPHRRQRGQPRAPAVPVAVRRCHDHPAGRSRGC